MNSVYSANKAFFAFNESQFKEGKTLYGITEEVKMVNMGAGLLCPEKNVKQLEKDMTEERKKSIQKDKKENGAIAIIKRQLYNYECQITGHSGDAKAALSDYGFTDEDFSNAWKVFWKECIENDSF